MTKTMPATTTPPSCVVRWVLTRGAARLTCEVDLTGGRFQLSVTPSVPGTRPILERFAGACAAMERHAEIASHLRDAGWRVAARSAAAAAVAA
jgi:hypothetical protein